MEEENGIDIIAYDCFEHSDTDYSYYMNKTTGEIMFIEFGEYFCEKRNQYVEMPPIFYKTVLDDMKKFHLTIKDRQQRLMLMHAFSCDYDINTFNFVVFITKLEDKWLEFQRKHKKERLSAFMKREGVSIDVQAKVLNEQVSQPKLLHFEDGKGGSEKCSGDVVGETID